MPKLYFENMDPNWVLDLCILGQRQMEFCGLNQLESSPVKTLKAESSSEGKVCHGHNILGVDMQYFILSGGTRDVLDECW